MSIETEHEKYHNYQNYIIEKRESRADKKMGQPVNIYYKSPTVSDYLKWILLPLVLGIFTCGIAGIFLLLIWAFKKSNNIARCNYARAVLIKYAIFFALFMFVIFIQMVTNFNNYMRLQ